MYKAYNTTLRRYRWLVSPLTNWKRGMLAISEKVEEGGFYAIVGVWHDLYLKLYGYKLRVPP